MKDVTTYIVVAIIAFVVIGCLPKTQGFEPFDDGIRLSEQAAQNLQAARAKAGRVVAENCNVNGAIVPDCSFRDGDPEAFAADEAAYKACITQYEEAVKKNWESMTKAQRASVGFKMIASCQQ